ncbi:MAG TPA: transcriptional regulator [Clostridiales bacterium]|nr:transcriptional regulator [Clostridiales bacterium]HCT84727.1 transcriptional regulator [Candidatus Margulisiibacteriota bacterium]
MANNLKRLRNDKGISQQTLADKVGLSRTTINNIEHDRVDPSIKNLQLLANALGVHIKEFFQ